MSGATKAQGAMAAPMPATAASIMELLCWNSRSSGAGGREIPTSSLHTAQLSRKVAACRRGRRAIASTVIPAGVTVGAPTGP